RGREWARARDAGGASGSGTGERRARRGRSPRHRHGHAVRRSRKRTGAEAVPLPRVYRASHRPRVRARGGTDMTDSTTVLRYEARLPQLSELVASLGAPAYRPQQSFEGVYEQRRPLDDLTNIPKTLRAQLTELLPLAFTPAALQFADDDTTAKWLWRAADGTQVETVLMRYTDRATVCVSSQAGCAMGCTFCATGQAGFERHLSAGEVVQQVLRAPHVSPQRASNVVFMGMGEPLANVDAVLAACPRLPDDAATPARPPPVSPAGVAPGMQRLRESPLPVPLAVSLHAPDDAPREQLVPLNRRYPIAAVLDAARAY